MWKKILISIMRGDKEIKSPFDKEGYIDFVFVLVDDINKMGFLWIWCNKTFKGINLSRMKIPENVKYVLSDDFSKMNLPKIDFVNPSENRGGL